MDDSTPWLKKVGVGLTLALQTVGLIYFAATTKVQMESSISALERDVGRINRKLESISFNDKRISKIENTRFSHQDAKEIDVELRQIQERLAKREWWGLVIIENRDRLRKLEK